MKTIVTSPSFNYLGEELAKELDIQRADVKIGRFPDNTPRVLIEQEDIEDRVATVLLDFANVDDLFLNYSVLQGLINHKVGALNIIMPYFPVGTMERVGSPGEVATAHTFANIISNLPSGKSGRKNNLHILDIHAESSEFLFDSKYINVETHTALELLKTKIQGKTIVFPDEGAAKRFGNIFNGYDIVICSKKRVGAKRIIEIKEGEVRGGDMIIIDDLIQSGGTIIETASVLKELGAKSVDAFASHGVFPGKSHQKISQALDTLWVSDSIPQNRARAENIDNMQIIEMLPLVKDIVIKN